MARKGRFGLELHDANCKNLRFYVNSLQIFINQGAPCDALLVGIPGFATISFRLKASLFSLYDATSDDDNVTALL